MKNLPKIDQKSQNNHQGFNINRKNVPKLIEKQLKSPDLTENPKNHEKSTKNWSKNKLNSRFDCKSQKNLPKLIENRMKIIKNPPKCSKIGREANKNYQFSYNPENHLKSTKKLVKNQNKNVTKRTKSHKKFQNWSRNE